MPVRQVVDQAKRNGDSKQYKSSRSMMLRQENQCLMRTLGYWQRFQRSKVCASMLGMAASIHVPQ